MKPRRAVRDLSTRLLTELPDVSRQGTYTYYCAGRNCPGPSADRPAGGCSAKFAGIAHSLVEAAPDSAYGPPGVPYVLVTADFNTSPYSLYQVYISPRSGPT